MSDDTLGGRMKTIIDSVPSIKARIGDNEVRHIPKRSGHASTNPGSNRITINSNWASGVTDKRLQATMYHESIHVDQHEKGLKGSAVVPVQEFHAHNRELRHAMKHGLYSQEDMQGKLTKINKYAGKVKADFPHLSDNVDRQLDRISQGKAPAKHSTNYWKKRITPPTT